MSRRKQAKPRFLKHDENTDGENPIATTSTAENHVNDDSGEDDDQDDEEFDEDGDEGKKYKIEDEDYQDGGAGGDDDEEGGEDEDENNSEDEEIDDDESSDSFCSDVFSSHTSSSFSPSLSDGIATPNSMTQMEHENVVANGGGGCAEGAAGIVGGDGGGINIQNTKKSTDGRNTIENGKIPKEHHHHGHHHAGLSNKSSKMKVGSDGSYHCQFCEKTFPRLGYLKKHEQSHAEHMPFKCDYCARLFKHKRSRDRHTKLHTGDRRYKCPHCEAAFSRSDHLKIHMKTHDNQKPFQCTVCNRGYNTAAALTSHMQNHKKQAALTGNPMLTYSPRSTGSGSSTTSSTQKRKYSSSLEHPYGGGTRLSCIYCTKSDFTTLEQLNIHVQAMHAPRIETPHSVPSPNLTLTCEFCTMKFPTIQSLLHHLKTSHLDRISSPSSYLEHFNRMSYDLYASSPARAGSGGGLTFEPVIKSEAKTPDDKLLEKSNSTPPIKIKQEDEQDSPTDLSQPKIRKVVKEEPTNHNNNNIEVPATPASTVAGGTFLCNQCNAALPDFESFRKHLKTHLESGVGSYLCQHCGVAFNEQQIYEKHIFSHFLITSSEFTCPQSCGKSFAKQEEYQKHMLETHIHNLFKCELCAEIFDTKVAIQVHMAVAHSNEIKLSRCSACMEVFRNERDFRHHVRTRHIVSGAVQCIFCRTICSSELDMHFHLAAHARQYRCPVCPESFHVEFLLDRHLQMHHAKDGYHQKAITNNNNNNIEYGSSSINKIPYGFPSKFYNNDTALPSKHPNLLHGLYDTINKTQRFTSENGFLSPSSKDLLGLYNNRQDMISKLNTFYSSSSNDYHAQQPQHRFPPSQHHHQSSTTPEAAPPQPNHKNHFHPSAGNGDENAGKTANRYHAPAASADKGYSCGMCERNDFSTESEVHTHRKLAHNLKTGVSLRCAYCNGDFRSRSELENHMKVTHNTSGKHKCLICDEIFPSPAVLAEHKLTHCKVGPSGRCSHCSAALKDVTFFKSHLAEHNGHDIPIQCICCRQTLNSEFEIGLHAKFHTKSSDIKENTCALCLETIPSNAETRVCENCYKKHNLNLKTQKNMLTNMNTEMQCNLCKKFYPSSLKLQEHLIEHTFAGCEDRGYICYICSSVFTASAGLQAHIVEHGLNARPYDCSSCTAKFFFRSELEHHTFEHEHMNPTKRPSSNNPPPLPPLPPTDITNRSRTASAPPPPEPPRENILKEEKLDSDDDFVEPTPDNSEGILRPEDDDEEYIEVDNVDGSTAEKEAKPLEPPMDGGSTETQQKH